MLGPVKLILKETVVDIHSKTIQNMAVLFHYVPTAICWPNACRFGHFFFFSISFQALIHRPIKNTQFGHHSLMTKNDKRPVKCFLWNTPFGQSFNELSGQFTLNLILWIKPNGVGIMYFIISLLWSARIVGYIVSSLFFEQICHLAKRIVII